MYDCKAKMTISEPEIRPSQCRLRKILRKYNCCLVAEILLYGNIIRCYNERTAIVPDIFDTRISAQLGTQFIYCRLTTSQLSYYGSRLQAFYPSSELIFSWFTAVWFYVGEQFFEVAILKSRKVLDKFGNSIRLMARQDTSFASPDSCFPLDEVNRPLLRCY